MLVSIGAESIPQVEFFKRQESEEKGEKVCTLSMFPTQQVSYFGNSNFLLEAGGGGKG